MFHVKNLSNELNLIVKVNKPTPTEIKCFPSRTNSVKSAIDYNNGMSPSLPSELMKETTPPKFKPSDSNIIKNK